MGVATAKSLYQSPREKALARALADPGVDQSAADEHVARALAEIQARWSEREARSRCAYDTPEVQIPGIHGGYKWHGVRQLEADRT